VQKRQYCNEVERLIYHSLLTYSDLIIGLYRIFDYTMRNYVVFSDRSYFLESADYFRMAQQRASKNILRRFGTMDNRLSRRCKA